MKKLRKKIRLVRMVAIVALAVALLVAVLFSALLGDGLIRPVLPESGASFLFLSVDQANCTLILSESGTVVVDTGSNASESTVIAALKHYGVTEIDCLILTHADEDHSGGLDAILERYTVERLLLSRGSYEALSKTRSGDALSEKAENGETECVLIEEHIELPYGDLSVEAFALRRGDLKPEEIGSNDDGVFARVRYGESDVLFPGDASIELEEEMISVLSERYPDLACEVLLVGHHGSNTSSCQAFVDFLSPRYAVISCGQDNSYGHPAAAVLNRFYDIGATVLRTPTDGTIVLHSDGVNITQLK